MDSCLEFTELSEFAFSIFSRTGVVGSLPEVKQGIAGRGSKGCLENVTLKLSYDPGVEFTMREVGVLGVNVVCIFGSKLTMGYQWNTLFRRISVSTPHS